MVTKSFTKDLIETEGIPFTYSVSALGYATTSGTVTLTKDTTININLENDGYVVWTSSKSSSGVSVWTDTLTSKYIEGTYDSTSNTYKLLKSDVDGTPYQIRLGDDARVRGINSKVLFINVPSLTVCTSMFRDGDMTEVCSFDVPAALNCYEMFWNCTKLTSVGKLGTTAATNMGSMFGGDVKLVEIKGIETSNVTDMSYMFSTCTSLTTIPQLDTSNVTNMGGMFLRCTSLKTIPQLDTSKVTNMYGTFQGCTSLTSIPELDITSITEGGYLPDVYNCTSLTDVGGFKNAGLNLTTSSSLKFQWCPLTHQSAMNIINDLANVSLEMNLNFSEDTFNTLTEDEIAIATSKGWTVVSKTA